MNRSANHRVAWKVLGVTLSAGASVVIPHSALAQDARPAYSLVVEPLAAAGRSGRQSIEPVGSAAIAADGRLVVSQRASMGVRVYSADGRLLRTIGRRGDGPGEFRDVTAVGLVGDTLWVSDDRARRVSFFTLGGELLRTERYTGLSARATVLGVLSGGSVLSADMELARAVAADTVYVATVSLTSGGAPGTGRPIVSVRSAPDVFRFALSPDGGAGVALRAPFAERPLVKPLPGGAGFIVVNAPRPSASSSFAEVGVHRSNGDRQSLRRVPLQLRRLSRGFVDTLVSLAVLQTTVGSTAPPAAEVDRYRRWLLRNEWVPPFSQLLVDQVGASLLQYAQAPHRWLLVPDSPQVPGDLLLPDRTIPIAFKGQSIWLLQFDEFDVPELRLYRIASPPSRRAR